MDIFLVILKYPRLDWGKIKLMAQQHHQEKHLACGLVELSNLVPHGFLPESLLSWATKKWSLAPKTLNSARDELLHLFCLHPKPAIFDIFCYVLLPHIQDWRYSQAKSLLNPRLWLSRPLRLLKAYG
jgi:hypothetical protein